MRRLICALFGHQPRGQLFPGIAFDSRHAVCDRCHELVRLR